MNKHTFACYTENLSDALKCANTESVVTFKNSDVHNRIVKVLRYVEKGDGCKFIFFDKKNAVQGTLSPNGLSLKNKITFTLEKELPRTPLAPKIRFFMPILKKAKLEENLYTAAQMGVAEIHGITTEKVLHKWPQHSKKRFEKIMLAACEQAKHFTVPQIFEKKPVEEAIKVCTDDELKIFFETGERPFRDLISKLTEEKHSVINIVVGPSGGLTNSEIEILRNHGFIGYKLTPTIMRSEVATVLALGAVRSTCFD
ncbi:RsmE family RNA methyltransferase [bacterium]|jgi:16S rRNA (uracil1498-N3)-methyltransferase|nr:RsmE family RNA methyltransferase [bacterium]